LRKPVKAIFFENWSLHWVNGAEAVADVTLGHSRELSYGGGQERSRGLHQHCFLLIAKGLSARASPCPGDDGGERRPQPSMENNPISQRKTHTWVRLPPRPIR
jgi:hypothetical protein